MKGQVFVCLGCESKNGSGRELKANKLEDGIVVNRLVFPHCWLTVSGDGFSGEWPENCTQNIPNEHCQAPSLWVSLDDLKESRGEDIPFIEGDEKEVDCSFCENEVDWCPPKRCLVKIAGGLERLYGCPFKDAPYDDIKWNESL